MLSLAVCLAFVVPATAVCLVYLACTLLGVRKIPRWRVGLTKRDPSEPCVFTILIPAHNEQTTLPSALRSIAAQDYPPDRVRVLVVADNCMDRTADVALEHGAECLVRTDVHRIGKGFAIAAGIEFNRLSFRDCVLILDADCELSPNALRELDVVFAAGAEVVQTAVWSRNADDGPSGYVAAVGAAIDDAVAEGRDHLGLRVPLRGTGMALRREVLAKVKWDTASPVEDAEYDSQLRRAGVRVRFCREAVVWCEAPATVSGLCRQRRRWALAGPLASKPLLLAHLLAAVAVCFAANAFTLWAGSLLLATGFVYLQAMAKVGFTRHRLGQLLATPVVVLRLFGVVILGLVHSKKLEWDRTPRLGEGRTG